MSQPVIVLGDRTSHGGTVIGASSASDSHGRRIARVGDMVTCRRCKGVFPISQGDNSLIVDGAPAAFHGCKVACGATLIASQCSTTTDPSTGAAGDAMSSLATDAAGTVVASIGGGLAAGYEDEPIDAEGIRFRGRFKLVDAVTGEPISGRAARVRSTGGQYATETTDAAGHTRWIERGAVEALAFDLPEDAKA